jgi:hypothetical protein
MKPKGVVSDGFLEEFRRSIEAEALFDRSVSQTTSFLHQYSSPPPIHLPARVKVNL